MNDVLFIGIILSLVFAELTGLSPGGIIVPAYFAMYSYDLKRMLGTVLLAVLCTVAVRLLSRYLILYGRRRFAVFVISGIVLKLLIGLSSGNTGLSIGYLIPGILGRDMEKQGCALTLLSLGIVLLFIRLIIIFVR